MKKPLTLESLYVSTVALYNQYYNVDGLEINLDSTLEDLIRDSLDLVELEMDLENEYGFCLSEREYEHTGETTVRQFLLTIISHVTQEGKVNL